MNDKIPKLGRESAQKGAPMTLDAFLDDLKAKAAAATPGPRHFCNENVRGGIYKGDFDHSVFQTSDAGGGPGQQDRGCTDSGANTIAASSEWTVGEDEDWLFLAAVDPQIVAALCDVARAAWENHDVAACRGDEPAVPNCDLCGPLDRLANAAGARR